MIDGAIIALLWVCAIGCGLVAGVFFAFSTFVMAALARLPDAAGIAAMQAINRVILRSPFMPLFFGTTLASAVAVVAGIARWETAAGRTMVVGGAIYVAGMFLVTVVRNVPLNNELADVDGDHPHAEAIWARYLRDWSRWNHLRSVASALASGAFIRAFGA